MKLFCAFWQLSQKINILVCNSTCFNFPSLKVVDTYSDSLEHDCFVGSDKHNATVF